MRPYLYALIPITLVLVLYVINADRMGRESERRSSAAMKASQETSDRLAKIRGKSAPGQAPADYSISGPSPRLLECRVCLGKVSSAADKCPHCGNPQ